MVLNNKTVIVLLLLRVPVRNTLDVEILLQRKKKNMFKNMGTRSWSNQMAKALVELQKVKLMVNILFFLF